MDLEDVRRCGRKLILCCDGTWNKPSRDRAPTNVLKLARAIRPLDAAGTSQILFYHPGVGTGNALDRLLGGALGVGLSENIRTAYGFLTDNYQDRDEIFLFGFSRGAFTVRSLGGLIGLVGLLRKAEMHLLPLAYTLYRARRESDDKARIRQAVAAEDPGALEPILARLLPREAAPDRGRLAEALVAARRPRIFFIGVWDTVGSLGMPDGWLSWIGRSRHAFHDTHLGDSVHHACQALAIDERRANFQPTLWTIREDTAPVPGQVIEQVWFAGGHANIGGGYPDPVLSDIALLWMVGKLADACDAENGVSALQLDEAYLGGIAARAGDLIDESRRRLLWRLLPRAPRRLFQPGTAGTEKIHESALLRFRWGEPGDFAPSPYRPENARGLLAAGACLPSGGTVPVASLSSLERRLGLWLRAYREACGPGETAFEEALGTAPSSSAMASAVGGAS